MEKTHLITKKPVHLDITLKPATWIDPKLFAKQIAEAGYAARMDDIRLTLHGKIEREGDHFSLIVDDVRPGPQRFLLEPAASKDAKETAAFKEAYGKLAEMAGKAVELEGWWRAPAKKEGSATLQVRAVKLQS